MSKQSAAKSNPPQPANSTGLVKVFYDGEKIILPEGFHHEQGEVFMFFPSEDDITAWDAMLLSQKSLMRAWDNDEDDDYNDL